MLTLDIETYSSVDISNGVYAYVTAPDFEILMIAYSDVIYSYNRGVDVIYGRGIVDLASGEQIPKWLLDAISDSSCHKAAANAQFERICLSKHLGVHLTPQGWYCTLVRASAFGLPASLGAVAEALKLTDQKDKEGKALIRYFCMPCKPTKANGMRTRNLPHHAPEKWQRFLDYCEQDVRAEEGIDDWLDNQGYQLSDYEQQLYWLDQKINDRGMALDMELVHAAIATDTACIDASIARMRHLTGSLNPASGKQLLEWLTLQGLDVADTQAATISTLINDCTCPVVREVLQLKQLVSKTSNAKYHAMVSSVCPDGRVRGLLQFNGASRTGRWAGRVVQIQNLPRTHLEDIDTARAAVKQGIADIMYGDVTSILSQLIRTAFIGDLAVADYSAIEARVLAWLAGEKWRLEVFATHGKIYEASAAEMFNVPLERIKKGNPEYALRGKGKIAELALGYQGGDGALVQMGALDMGLKKSELQPLVDAWRLANPAIVSFWNDCNKAALEALNGVKTKVGYVTFKTVRNDLHIVLPSGRAIVYHSAALGTNRWGKATVTHMGTNQYTRKWERMDTYGGKLVENITQAVARDCLAHCLTRLDAAGIDIIGHVHDEVIAEDCALEDMIEVMSQEIPWAPGLVLKGEGYASPYYKKD